MGWNPSVVEPTALGDLDEVVGEWDQGSAATTGVAREDIELVTRAIVNSELLNELRSDQLEYLLECGSVGRLSEGDKLAAGNYQLVLDGQVAVLHPASDTITYLGRGSIVGPGQGFAARAAVEFRVLSIPRRTMQELCAQSRCVNQALVSLAERRARHLVLAAHEFYAEIGPEERAHYVSKHEHVSIAAGSNLIVENDPVDAFCIVLDGTLEAASEAGVVGWLRNGDIFGHVELIFGSTALCTVTARTTSRIAQLARPFFLELISSQPQVLARLTKSIGDGEARWDHVLLSERTEGEGRSRQLGGNSMEQTSMAVESAIDRRLAAPPGRGSGGVATAGPRSRR